MNANGLLAFALFVSLTSTVAVADMPRQVPKDGTLSPGEVVLVDDGRCPAGEVKQVTGGNKAKNIPREVKCVPKPQ
jgi:hypothetical protein